jgi:hypothetical protein
MPETGAFHVYAARYLGPATGYTVAWLYWLTWTKSVLAFSKMASAPPDYFAIEQVFMAKNADSALKLGQARGVAIVADRACSCDNVPLNKTSQGSEVKF